MYSGTQSQNIFCEILHFTTLSQATLQILKIPRGPAAFEMCGSWYQVKKSFEMGNIEEITTIFVLKL